MEVESFFCNVHVTSHDVTYRTNTTTNNPTPSTNFSLSTPKSHTDKFGTSGKMGGDKIRKDKRQKREEYRASMRREDISELPRKKFYRQRAHANPFSDHQLI